MIKKVDQTTVSAIFSLNNNTIYRIPKYQREYTWGKSEWEALFNDILENEPGYFLGSYICVSKGTMGDAELEVIDGQQRFTTILVLLTVLYQKLNEKRENLDEDETNDLNNLRKEIANRKADSLSSGKRKTVYEQRLFLQKQNTNDDDFSYILSRDGVISKRIEEPSKFGLRRLSRACKQFAYLIDDEVKKRKEEKSRVREIDILFEIVEKVEKAIMVGIEVDSNKDAYILFESLNHRGVPLSAIDLIKNTLIANAKSEMDADNSYEIWKQVLNYVGWDDYSVQERFFRQYYNAFRDSINSRYKAKGKQKYFFGNLATRTTLLDIYEKIIRTDYHMLLDDIVEKAEKYSIIINSTDLSYAYSESLEDLARISGAPSYILLLYVLSNQESLQLTDRNINEIIRTLITFFVRRSVTDTPGTRKLNQFFIDVIGAIKNKRGNAVVEAIHKEIKRVAADNRLFKEKLSGPVYDENPDATRFLLCNIEKTQRTKEINTDLWSRDESNKKYIWTIEHIFPEGERIPSSWAKMIADGDYQLAKEYQSRYVHTLGNLTITGYNSNLSNLPFEAKKNRKSREGKSIGYKNGLYLNKSVARERKWTVEKIERRTQEMVDFLLKMYKL